MSDTANSGLSAITRADAGSADAMAQSLCEAFADDPGLGWIWPDGADRLARLPHFFAAIVGGSLANGIGFSSEGHDAVSLWRQPGRIHPDAAEIGRTQASLAAAFSTGGERSQAMSVTLKAHQPRDFDWWYLQFVGVRPSAQGSRLGGAVVRAGLEAARAAVMPVYVEVMNPANLGFYRHLGFAPLAEFDIPDGGPHVWSMIRR